jgi:2-hydroxy-3-oxopropionate reductase
VASTILARGSRGFADRSGLTCPRCSICCRGAGSRILSTRGERIVAEDYSPSGPAKYMVKDLHFATTIAAATDSHPVLLPAVTAAFDELVERGLGEFDIAVTRRFVGLRRGADGHER